MKSLSEFCFDNRVSVVRLASPAYGDAQVGAAIAKLAGHLGWPDGQRGSLSNVIEPGARVLIKPNFVLHENQGPWGIEPLFTHSSLVILTAEAALEAGAAEVLVGDAPIQSCDFTSLLKSAGLDRWAEELMQREPRFKGVRDFRRTTCSFENGVRVANENLLDEDRFVLMDVAQESLLEPISDGRGSFRVTRYDPRLMSKTHAPGKHQYLVAREALEADVVINLPKLKTHKKAGVTCALKNLIGINGNKEYLPHHRVGGAQAGGDCYPGSSRIKRALEYSLDRQNMAGSAAAARLWNDVANNLDRAARLTVDSLGVEGSWSGNDTIWRTCLDLNRILLYGCVNGTMAAAPQRRVVHIVDAIVAGHGDGPLSPQPLKLGMILAGQNAAAVDWVGAALLGFDPSRLPVVREAFGRFNWPISASAIGDVVLKGDLGTGPADDVLRDYVPPSSITYPIGWRDALR